jgi:predicted ATPase
LIGYLVSDICISMFHFIVSDIYNGMFLSTLAKYCVDDGVVVSLTYNTLPVIHF